MRNTLIEENFINGKVINQQKQQKICFCINLQGFHKTHRFPSMSQLIVAANI